MNRTKRELKKLAQSEGLEVVSLEKRRHYKMVLACGPRTKTFYHGGTSSCARALLNLRALMRRFARGED